MTKRFNVAILGVLHRRLKVEAAQRGLTIQQLLQEILRKHFRDRGLAKEGQ